jgi:TPP-dependent 2-oxoacid decarboxylase
VRFVFVRTPTGKGSMSEVHPCFGGLYAGEMSNKTAKHYVEAADCVLKIGNYPVGGQRPYEQSKEHILTCI